MRSELTGGIRREYWLPVWENLRAAGWKTGALDMTMQEWVDAWAVAWGVVW